MSQPLHLEHGPCKLNASTCVTLGTPEQDSVWADLPFLVESTSHLENHDHLGPGRLERASALREGIRVTREIYHLASGDAVACRLLVTNDRTEPVPIVSATPLLVEGLTLGNTAVSEWSYLRAPRKKNDMPACIRLGDEGPASWDAARGTPETGGVIRSHDSEAPRRFISSELTALFTDDAACVIGVLPADRQLVQCVLDLSPDREKIESFHVDCLGDGQLIMPGAQFESQWVVARFGTDVHETIEAYTTHLAAVQPPRQQTGQPPTVWCSWYYYGDGFTQTECEQNLTALEQRPLPIDVFQIDECWDLHWADWRPNPDWPDLAGIATRIENLGLQPGIWTCPVLAESRSRTRYAHPEWLLYDAEGRPITFPMNSMQNLVLDTTIPEVLDFISDIYRYLREQGYTYFKLDFMRAVAESGGVFADATCNRADAFRMALEAVRRGAGDDAYINVCGGFYGPSLGLADAQRSGSDVKSLWPEAPAGEAEGGYGPFTIKQNTLRYWMNRLWHIDPDALMVRRRPEAARGETLSLGLLNDDEALTCALNQYLGGGIVCFSENLAEIDDDRLMLLRHCAPSVGAAAVPSDLRSGPRFPALFTTAVEPRAQGLPSWQTISVVNWFDEPGTFEIILDATLLGPLLGEPHRNDAPLQLSRFSAGISEQAHQGDRILIGPIPPHGCEVVKVQRVNGNEPRLLCTDGHFCMGGVEILEWSPTAHGLDAKVQWRWPVPLSLWIQPAHGRHFEEAATDEAICVKVDGPVGEHDLHLSYG